MRPEEVVGTRAGVEPGLFQAVDADVVVVAVPLPDVVVVAIVVVGVVRFA